MPEFISISLKKAKEGFFDRKAVMDATDRATHRVLSKFGAFVMTGARRSMRRTRKTSEPGRPPSAHVGLIRDLTVFSYDADRRSVVIGPTLISRPTGAPKTLEYGGTITITQHKKSKTVHIQPRPFMQPAFEKELPKLPAMWANSVKK